MLLQAQSSLRKLDAKMHTKLVNVLTVKLLTAQGRGADTDIAHLTPGEIVLPRSMQTPAIVKALANSARENGLELERFIVGKGHAVINPLTSAEEFQVLEQSQRNAVEPGQWAQDNAQISSAAPEALVSLEAELQNLREFAEKLSDEYRRETMNRDQLLRACGSKI
jgi:hypothetical protein